MESISNVALKILSLAASKCSVVFKFFLVREQVSSGIVLRASLFVYKKYVESPISCNTWTQKCPVTVIFEELKL